nr:envelope biogenesis factor ElyC [uncultured Tolumonas sp.]
MLFLLKKWLGLLLMPLPFCALLLFVGLFLLWSTRWQKSGKLLISIATIVLIMFSVRPTSVMLNRPLEQMYPAFPDNQPVDFIIVLGHGHVSDPSVPLASQLTEAASARIQEALRIKRLNPKAHMIFSGSIAGDPISGAEMYARVAEASGVARNDMTLIENARDTEEEVARDSQLISNHPTALVTSASHMPRAMTLFHQVGMNPIPAPAQYVGREQQLQIPAYGYLPSGRYLMYSEMALHEWIGQLWNRFRN